MRRLSSVMLTLTLWSGIALAQTPPDASAPPVAASGDTSSGDTGSGDTASGNLGGHGGGTMQKMQAKFAAANTSHDGHLTLAQAQAANLRPVAQNFAAIDTAKHGYVTMNDIMAWHLDQQAQKLEQKAAALRAQD